MQDPIEHEMIRVIAFREDETWVAQCLEYDIGAQANDLPTLRRRLNAVITADIEESVRRHGKPFAGIDSAPPCYERMWNASVETGSMGRTDVKPSNSSPVEYELAMCA